MKNYFDIRINNKYKNRAKQQSDKFFTNNPTLIEALIELLDEGKIAESLVRNKIIESKK